MNYPQINGWPCVPDPPDSYYHPYEGEDCEERCPVCERINCKCEKDLDNETPTPQDTNNQ